MTEEDNFDKKFSSFKSQEGKHESLYIFVVNNLIIESFVEKIKKMLGLIDEIQNPTRRSFLKTRLGTFLKHLTGIKSETCVKSIFMISDDIEEIRIEPYWSETLKIFSCENFLMKYANKFDIDWLKNLLLDRSFIHVLHVKGNLLKHVHLGNTKKKVNLEREEKGMSMQSYIQENIPKGDLCIIHGISSLIKNIDPSPNIKILNGHKKDDEIEHEYQKVLNDRNAEMLQWWLDRMTSPKEGQKIAFGKDISKCIEERTLETLFCSTEMKKKVIEKIPKDCLIFKIVEVKSFGEDVGKRLVSDFKGGVGVKFY